MDPTRTQPIGSGAFAEDARLRRVQQFLHSDLSEHLSLARAARIAELHPGYFSTYFHEKTGMRFVEWVRRVRVARAKQMLLATSLPVHEIAYLVGYRDPGTFGRAFKRLTSMTPGEFRAQPRSWHARRRCDAEAVASQR